MYYVCHGCINFVMDVLYLSWVYYAYRGFITFVKNVLFVCLVSVQALCSECHIITSKMLHRITFS